MDPVQLQIDRIARGRQLHEMAPEERRSINRIIYTDRMRRDGASPVQIEATLAELFNESGSACKGKFECSEGACMCSVLARKEDMKSLGQQARDRALDLVMEAKRADHVDPKKAREARAERNRSAWKTDTTPAPKADPRSAREARAARNREAYKG